MDGSESSQRHGRSIEGRRGRSCGAWQSDAVIVHLLGLPGTGKYTVAQALGLHAADVGETFVVVDNHLTSLPVLEVVGADGVAPLDAGVWDLVGEIREVVYRAIEELAPPERSFVFTNVLVESDPRNKAVVDRLKRLAQVRASRYVAVMLVCDEAELRRRVVGSDRSVRRKWVDPDAVIQFAHRETLVRPSGEVMDIDVTTLSAAEAAIEIVRRLTLGETAP